MGLCWKARGGDRIYWYSCTKGVLFFRFWESFHYTGLFNCFYTFFFLFYLLYLTVFLRFALVLILNTCVSSEVGFD